AQGETVDPSAGVQSQASALVSKSSLASRKSTDSQARRPDAPPSVKFSETVSTPVPSRLERFEDHEENRQSNKYQWELHGQPRNDRNRQRPLHGRALAYSQSQRKESEGRS